MGLEYDPPPLARRWQSPPENRLVREKYARPRNTAQSIAKAQKVNAALDVLEARSKPRPGLHIFFIQPNE